MSKRTWFGIWRIALAGTEFRGSGDWIGGHRTDRGGWPVRRTGCCAGCRRRSGAAAGGGRGLHGGAGRRGVDGIRARVRECHGPDLDGMEGPALRGTEFLNSWAGQTTDELFTYMRDEMPPGLGGSLSDQVYLNLIAYLLDANGAWPGDAPLTADAAVMIGDAADVAEARRAARAGDAPRRLSTRFVNREAERLTPVTDALLQDPPPG